MHKTMYKHNKEELENLFNIYYKSSVTGEELDIEADPGIMNYMQITEMLLCLGIGIGIDTAYNSKLPLFHKMLAVHGHYLDKLVHSDQWDIRSIVAQHGYGLDILINDEDWQIRTFVVQHGYGLDILINDENYFVREAVNKYLKEAEKSVVN